MKIKRIIGLLFIFARILPGCDTIKTTTTKDKTQEYDFAEEKIENSDSESSLSWEGLFDDGIAESVIWETVTEADLKDMALQIQGLNGLIEKKHRKEPAYAPTAA